MAKAAGGVVRQPKMQEGEGRPVFSGWMRKLSGENSRGLGAKLNTIEVCIAPCAHVSVVYVGKSQSCMVSQTWQPRWFVVREADVADGLVEDDEDYYYTPPTCVRDLVTLVTLPGAPAPACAHST